MIGGSDIILQARDEKAAMDLAIRTILRMWKDAVFEDADTGQAFHSYCQIDLQGRPEILAYRDEQSQLDWKENGPCAANDGKMIHLIGRRQQLTIGLDDVPGPAVLSIVDAIRGSLHKALFASTAELVAA